MSYDMGVSRKKIKTPICLSKLPEDIVEHIFSRLHLNNKTAIQLSLLSKELHSILQRRPALVFDHEQCFEEEASDSEYEKRYRQELNYMVSTLERYQEQNIHLQTFTFKANLYLSIERHLLDRLIPFSIQKGITNLNLSLPHSRRKYPVPQSVFEAESLVELSLESCTLHPERGRVAWRNLKRLHLEFVEFGDDMVFEDIARGTSSSIECLKIWSCRGSKSETLSYKIPSDWTANLKQLKMNLLGSQTLDWNPLQNLQVRPECKNLRSLYLDMARIEDDIFFNFPRLEKLDIRNCQNETIKISSLSLKKITLENSRALQEASFDVPNIVKFQLLDGIYTGRAFTIPKLSFRGNSRGWVSNIDVSVSADTDFLKLKMFLAALLNSSKITVTVNLGGEAILDEANLITLPGPIPEIEEFCVRTMERTYSSSFARAILNGIFGICWPKRLVFRHWSNEYRLANFSKVENLYLWNATLPPTSHFDKLLKLLQDHEKMDSFRTIFNLEYRIITQIEMENLNSVK